MSKRYFRVTTQSCYGGEIVVGTVSQEFVDFWSGNEEGLIEALWDYNDSKPEGAPALSLDGDDEYAEWHEVDDIEHYSSCNEESPLWICEVDKDGNEMGEELQFDEFGQTLYSREGGMIYDEIPEDYGQDDNWIPAMSFYSVEKGGFFNATIETDGEDFDPDKIHFGIIENGMDCLIESMYYGKEEIDLEYDFADTRGKDTIASVGYVNETYQKSDSCSVWASGSDNVKESLEEIYEEEVC